MAAIKQVGKRQSIPIPPNYQSDSLNKNQKEWLDRMRSTAELETMTVLFAKSIFEVGKRPGTTVAIRTQSYKKAQTRRSPSPQKCIVRMKTTFNEAIRHIGQVDQQYKSTIRIPSTSCESLANPKFVNRRRPSPTSSMPMSTSSSSSDEIIDRSRKNKERKKRRSKFAQSMPSITGFSMRKSEEVQMSKVRMRPNRSVAGKNSAFRHTIRIGDEKADELFNSQQNGVTIKCPNNMTSKPQIISSTTSPNSSLSSCSVDSGQCSGHGSCLMHKNLRQQIVPAMSDSTASSEFSSQIKRALPSYAQQMMTMDHVLRVASTIYSLLDADLEDSKVARELVHKVQIYTQIVQQSACHPFLIEEDFTLVSNTMQQISNYLPDEHKYLEALTYSNVVVRRMLEQSLIIFLRITVNYLNECTNKDRLLVIALEHLIHLLLFGDELCLEAIRCKTVDNILEFCHQPATSNETLKLLLRALAVLCGVPRGCIQLISINGGLDLVINLLNTRTTTCAIAEEAAGVLTQLTNPNYLFIRLLEGQIESIVVRLLELVDECRNSESLLLCTAALANLTLQNGNVVKILYERNAIQRLVNASARPDNSNNIFIQEQIVIIFSQLAACSYDQALVAQGAIPVLLKMLRVGELMPQRFDYSRRIRYKSAVCLAQIANNSLGLKAIYDNYGLDQLDLILQRENFNQNSPGNSPFLLVCANIRKQLNAIYKPMESAV